MDGITILAEGGGLFDGTMGLVIALAIGGVIGWLASILMKTNAQMGILANIGVGIAGSWGGHFLAHQIGLGASGTIGNLAISLGGAVLLIVVLRFFGVLK